MAIEALNTVSTNKQQLRKLSDSLEAQFLTETLKSAGVGKPRDAFGGGAGEDQFSSFLTREYADAIVAAGGIGLSEAIFQALVQKENAS